MESRPAGWDGPWLIERAHIVSQPRVEDRRAAILLCTVCHRVQHGEKIAQAEMRPVTLPEMLWLKSVRDPEFYDRRFLQRHHVGKLPRARNCLDVLGLYYYRRGF